MNKIKIELFTETRLLSQISKSNKLMFDYLLKNHHKTIDMLVLFRYGKPGLHSI